jgi:hypothetical protein
MKLIKDIGLYFMMKKKNNLLNKTEKLKPNKNKLIQEIFEEQF